MKIIVVIMISSLMQVSAASFAQKITFSKKGTNLEEVFKQITLQTGYNILYAPEKINESKKIDVNFKDTELKEVLDQLINSQPLTYVIDEKNIILKPKAPTFLERLANRWATIDISGRIVDAEGNGIPGATVSVKGSNKSAITGKNGIFNLSNVSEDAILLISYIGYAKKEVKVSGNLGDIVLEQSLSKLDEVQVIAYGTTTQRLSTGNVTTIKTDVIEKQPVNNPLLALQGRVPGLFIEQATGFAGTGVKVRIQGQNSINNGNDPLYVIDGIPFTSQLLPGGNSIVGNSGSLNSATGTYISSNPLNFINPMDIESIDILKDADATAIYGSRAANGAILITTKKGKAGDTRVDLNLQSGWAKVPHKLNLMNSQQYLEMRREAFKNDGIITPDPGPYVDSDLNGNWDTQRFTDWQKELIGGTATFQDASTSLSGGGDRISFLIGVGHHRETTVFPGSFADSKTSINFNLNNTSINQKFKIQFSGSYMFDDSKLPNYDLTSRAIQLAPVSPALFKADKSINWAPDETGKTTFASNPMGFMFNSFLNKTSNLMSYMNLNYQFIKNLDIKVALGYNKLSSNLTDKSLLQATPPENLPYRSRSTIFANQEISSWSIEPQLTYNYNISEGKLEVLLGTTISWNNSLGASIVSSGFSNDLVMDDILSATSLSAGSSTRSTYKYNAAFGRINYNWLDKYVLNVTGRRDGSSRFGPKSQFHNFAALGGAWVFSSEKLIAEHLQLLSFGKFRVSYGTTGSDQIGDYRALSLYDPLQVGIPYQGIVSYQPNRLINPYMQWEETRKLQFGLDLGFIKDRILLSANHYRNRSSNQLNGYVLPMTTGFGFIDQNLTDKVENSGWELAFTSTNFHHKYFKWTSSVNLTIPKTLLIATNDTRFSDKPIIGDPLSAIRVYHFLGVDPGTGIYQFEDHNGNPTSKPDPSLDKTVLINLAPEFYGGFQNSFFYKGFQLDLLFSFVKQTSKNQGFNNRDGALPGSGSGIGNQLVTLMDRWQKPGDISSIQRFSTNNSNLREALRAVYDSDAGWTDASYIRLKNISLSWQLPQIWSEHVNLQNCNLFIHGQNLLTFTNYKGLDPETKSSTTLPPLKVITIGLKVGL